MTFMNKHINHIDDSFLGFLDDKKLNEEQLNALRIDLNNQEQGEDLSINSNGNAVVAAGAGSGKTQVLATRFAWLILTGQAKVDEILTLTFTKKAAAEMYQRIYKTLNTFEKNPNIDKQQRAFARDAINNFANAHIQTLDSYCGSIVRQNASRYGIKPDFTTGSADSGIDIKVKAFKFIMQHKDDVGIQAFAQPGKLQEFAENSFGAAIAKYTSLGTEENYFINKLKIQVNEIVNAWNYYVTSTNKDICFMQPDGKYEDIKSIIGNITSELENTKITNNNSNYAAAVKKLIELGNNLTDTNAIDSNDIITCSEKVKKQISHIEAFFEECKKISNSFAKGYIQKIRTIITNIKNQQSLLYNSLIYFIKNYNPIYSINKLFDKFLNEINNSKRTSGNLSFSDISDMSIKILLENEDIRNQEKNAFKKIMIDEFQDNNGKNRDLLYILSIKEGAFEDNGSCVIHVDEEHPLISQIIVKDSNGVIVEDKRSENKLFFVGDEKQSIYKFRGADVSVFNELTKDRKENALFRMTHNYRSTPELVSAFNILFRNGNGIFGTEDRKVYEAYYDKDAISRDENMPALTEDNVPIHIKLIQNFNAESKKIYVSEKEQLAYNIAKDIYELGIKTNNWNNFAILQRSRTDSDIITKYLNMFNIPYSIDQFSNIFEEGIINDFYNFFRLCVYPSDMISFSAYLTSPLCGLNENAVEFILSHLIPASGKSNTAIAEIKDENIISAIKNDLDSLDKNTSNNSFDKYMAAMDFYRENKKDVLRQKITTTLSYLWNTRGYKYETYMSKKAQLISEHFDMFFELGRQTDQAGRSISWFVDQLALTKNKYSQEDADIDIKEISYPFEKDNSVKIMTIHKSKGLEFKNVFIYGCVDVPSKSSRMNVFYDEKTGISIKPDTEEKNYFSLIGEDRFRKEETAEFRRLIYVAVTRAENSVYIYGNWNPSTKSDSSLRLIENTVKQFYSNVSEEDAVKGKSNVFFIKNNKDLAFDYTNIIPCEYEKLINTYDNETPENVDKQREIVINNTSKIYQDAEIIKYKSNPLIRKTPSSLETHIDNEDIYKYEHIDKLPIDSVISEKFTAASFGTLVHSYLEAMTKNTPIKYYKPDSKLFGDLGKESIDILKEACAKMCSNFENSQLGKDLKRAKDANDFYRPEWHFKMFYNNAVFTGSMDLIFSNGDGTYTIVDYKTDKVIEPAIYTEQQLCYRAAAAKLLNKNEKDISIYLYYLRHDKIIKID